MYELTLQLDVNSYEHLYEQIYSYIKKEIRAGKLLQGEKLPSTRSLAEYLQISRSTVELAYEQLVSEGYIEAEPYRGYFVCKIEDLLYLTVADGKEEQKKGIVQEKYDFDFQINGIDMRGFPFATWKSIHKNTLLNHGDSLFQSGLPKGEIELRTTIGRYLHSSRGVNCEPEQIIIGAGNDYLLLLLEKIIGKDRVIAMEEPSYQRAYRIFQSCGYQIESIPMDESGIQLEPLSKSGANIAYVMPSHQYPMGIVMPIGRRLELLNWAMEQEDRYIIEDDYDSEFRYRGKPIPSLQASDYNGKVVYIGTFSKSIAPSIRVSYMVLPKKLLQMYEKYAYFFSSTVSRTDQAMLHDFIKDGFYERHLNKMRKIYKGKHDLLLHILKEFEGRFQVYGENAGLHLLLQTLGNQTEEELIMLAKKQGVKVYGLSDSFSKKEGHSRQFPSTILLGYGGLTEQEIVEGMERLKKAWFL